MYLIFSKLMETEWTLSRFWVCSERAFTSGPLCDRSQGWTAFFIKPSLMWKMRTAGTHQTLFLSCSHATHRLKFSHRFGALREKRGKCQDQEIQNNAPHTYVFNITLLDRRWCKALKMSIWGNIIITDFMKKYIAKSTQPLITKKSIF